MRALVADGRAGEALHGYDDLATRLRDDLGTTPGRETAELHVSVLRDAAPPAEPPAAVPVADGSTAAARPRARARPRRTRLGRGWARPARRLLLVEGEAGIGKTRFLDAVADLAAATGGRVLRGRCHPSERSMFLQPFVDALRPVAARPRPRPPWRRSCATTPLRGCR